MIELEGSRITEEILKFIGPGKYYQTTAYDTSLIISSQDKYRPFHHFEIFKRKILWINPVLKDNHPSGQKLVLMARTVFLCDEKDYDGGVVMNRFASLLCYITRGTHIVAAVHAGCGVPAACVIQPQQMLTAVAYDPEQINNLISQFEPDEISDKKWIALAHFRQGVIANTPYFHYLSLWKILELYFNDNDKEVDEHINRFFEINPGKIDLLPEGEQSASKKLRDIRNMSAHFALRGGPIQDPDNPDLYLKAESGIGTLQLIVRELIDNNLWTG